MGKYFGTDGVRGVAFEALNAQLAYKIGQGLKEALKNNKVVIGCDTRQSSTMLAHMVAAGAISSSCEVSYIGVCSTPMLAYYSKEKQMIGVMITASHNPYTDNGIKVFNNGYKTTDEEELVLEDYIDHPRKTIEDLGSFSLNTDFKEVYAKLYQPFSNLKSNLKIAYDSANGANYMIANELFNKYSNHSVQIGNTPNGLNINKNVGSTHIETLFDYVKQNHLDIGFSFDGDGDRILVCDQNKVYDGDQIIYIISLYLKKYNLLNKNHVVLTKMSNPGILKALKSHDINYALTDVGDKYVSLELTQNDYTIGGENSGHVILRHLLHTGDGLLVAIYLLYILEQEHTTLHELTKDLNLYPYQTVNLKNVDKSVLKENEMIQYLKDVKEELTEDSLLLVRASGTENLIRITVSHPQQEVVTNTIEKIIVKINEMGIK